MVLLSAGTLLALIRPEAPAKVSHRTLTFAERVAYQRAIEEVYWRHRIWPKNRSDPKPSLDAVMSRAQIEKKVVDYLRNEMRVRFPLPALSPMNTGQKTPARRQQSERRVSLGQRSLFDS
jgi:hypothetical protein